MDKLLNYRGVIVLEQPNQGGQYEPSGRRGVGGSQNFICAPEAYNFFLEEKQIFSLFLQFCSPSPPKKQSLRAYTHPSTPLN